MSFPTFPFTVLDTETTGFIPKTNRVIEFASVTYEGGKKVDEYEQLISIDHEIPPVVRVITRIEDSALEGKPAMDDVRDEILSHIGDDTVIIGQNVSFDIRMLAGEGIDLTDRPWIDTSMIASLVFPELESFSLGYVSKALDLNHDPVHRALGDVHATTELLERCWERLNELPAELQIVLKEVMSKSSPGYQILFSALEQATKSDDPSWFSFASQRPNNQSTNQQIDLPKPSLGTVDLLEEPLSADTLQALIDAAAADTETTHWIAVKNLEATLSDLTLTDAVRVLHPPFLLLDHSQVATLAQQESFTADEATLATKIAWWEPRVQNDIHIHGDERAVWSAKLAATDVAESYLDQFKDLPSVMLLDHRQLLAFLADPEHVAHGALTPESHIVITDASMLEDTATKAYGWYAKVDDLRAGSAGDEQLTKFVDLLALWVEKVREFQDVRYLAPSDFESPEVSALGDQLTNLLRSIAEGPLARQLSHLRKILTADNLKDRITWIEQRQDGAQTIQSVPERIGTFLQEHLYTKFPTTLIIPPDSSKTLTEVIPSGTETNLSTIHYPLSLPAITFDPETNIESFFSDPPEGHTVFLVGSKRTIEDVFVRFTEPLEQKDFTLICQSFSGGMGRMQAEYGAEKGSAIWVLTPWSYEGADLPHETVDRLVIQSLPFDHPSHTVLSRRAEHYGNAFMEYSLPRLQHRLFRLLRTYASHRKGEGEVRVLDERIETKKYGSEVWKTLKAFDAASQEAKDAKDAGETSSKKLTSQEAKKPTTKKRSRTVKPRKPSTANKPKKGITPSDEQLTLF